MPSRIRPARRGTEPVGDGAAVRRAGVRTADEPLRLVLVIGTATALLF